MKSTTFACVSRTVVVGDGASKFNEVGDGVGEENPAVFREYQGSAYPPRVAGRVETGTGTGTSSHTRHLQNEP